jgi:hypothetical protein
MPDEINYKLLEVPLLARNLAASRTPRLQPTAIPEFADSISREIAHGEWSYDPENGEPLHASGATLPQQLEQWLKPRAHALMPVNKGSDEDAEKVWLSGNITLQGQRLVHFEKFCGSKAAALVMWKEEAERFHAKAGSPLPGTKPGEKSDKKPAEKLSQNPWSASFSGDETQRTAKIASVIKTGTRFAEGLAKAAGTTVFRPLRK